MKGKNAVSQPARFLYLVLRILWISVHMGTAAPCNLPCKQSPDLRFILSIAGEEPGREEGWSVGTAPMAGHGWRREGDEAAARPHALVVGGIGWMVGGRQVVIELTHAAHNGVLQAGEREAYVLR